MTCDGEIYTVNPECHVRGRITFPTMACFGVLPGTTKAVVICTVMS